MLRNLIVKLKNTRLTEKFLRMADAIKEEVTEKIAQKRPNQSEPEVAKKKKKKKGQTQPVSLGPSENNVRKIAMLAAYNGTGYHGVQINKDIPTIEKDLFQALVKVGAIFEDYAENPKKMWFQRGSRTDKNVSASGQIFSLKVKLVPDFVDKVNENLPEKIRIIGYIRTTGRFDSKNFCDARTYMYMMPTFAFAPIEKVVTDAYRIEPDILEKARTVLKRFLGTHKFHNYTSGVKFTQACAARYIISFECSDPYVRDGIEFVTLRIKGQSFMLNQIRKMVGLTIAIVRGYCGEPVIDQCWSPGLVDVPKAPGLGLVLEELHYGGYNKKFGCDGIHDPIDWSQYKETVEKFKEDHILSQIVAQEKDEMIMLNWLQTLQYHNFGQPRDHGPQHPWANVNKKLEKIEPGKYDDENSPTTNLFELAEMKEESISEEKHHKGQGQNSTVKAESISEEEKSIGNGRDASVQGEESNLDEKQSKVNNEDFSIEEKGGNAAVKKIETTQDSCKLIDNVEPSLEKQTDSLAQRVKL